MAYQTFGELDTFNFSESTLLQIRYKDERVILTCSDVIISTSNSCNMEVEKMGTDEMTICFHQIEKLAAKKDGYKIYNLDDTLREEYPDEYLDEKELPKFFSDIEGMAIYQIVKKRDHYCIYIDTEETEVSYTIEIAAKKDEESWESHHRLPAHLR